MMGIYAIENIVTGECYVGQSKNIMSRFQQHLSMLAKGEHHSLKLQKAYNTMGVNNFTLKILELCEENLLDSKEQEWINKLDSVKNGYNMKVQDENRNRLLNSRVSDILYKQFKDYCNELGLSVSEAINIIVDRELEESRRNIDLLQSIKETLTIGNSFVLEETREINRTIRINTAPQPDTSEIIEKAIEYFSQNNEYPSIRKLAEIAGCTRYKAEKALKLITKA